MSQFYLADFCALQDCTPAEYQHLAEIAELLRKDQAERSRHETAEMYVMRILFQVSNQETARRRLMRL